MIHTFTLLEALRYSRQMALPEIGVEGQQKLQRSAVLVIGAGGLGSPAMMYLAAAGVGTIGIADPDIVEYSNLHRQVLHGGADVGVAKTASAQKKLEALNSNVAIRIHAERMTAQNAPDIIKNYDVIIDGSDNFPTKYLLNDACVKLRKYNVFAGIHRFEGRISVFHPDVSPCYRCLYPRPPKSATIPNCAEAGVLGALPGVMGSLQATEALKIIAAFGNPLFGRLVSYNALSLTFSEFRISKDPECPACGANPSITELEDYEVFCGVDRHEFDLPDGATINANELQNILQAHPEIALIDVREPHEFEAFHLPMALNIPLHSLRHHDWDSGTQQSIVTYCQSGQRSAQAVVLLREMGCNARSLVGGLEAWAAHATTDLRNNY